MVYLDVMANLRVFPQSNIIGKDSESKCHLAEQTVTQMASGSVLLLVLLIGVNVAFALLLLAIPLAPKFGRWQGEVDSDRASMEEFIAEVKTDIRAVRNQISKLVGLIPPAVAQTASPLQLTDLGQAIATKLNADEWARKNLANVKKRMNSSNPYDIQQTCFDFVKAFSEEEVINSWKECAYEHGVDLKEIRTVMSIALRDTVIGESPKPKKLQREGDPRTSLTA